jgi:D-tyrosyl-tRNA(Tyr) deacylase
MRLVIQRVSSATVKLEDKLVGSINSGLLVLLGIENGDDLTDVIWLVNKMLNLRIFNDSSGVINRSLTQVAGELLVISQFTLIASTKKGNRPSYICAAKHEIAIPLYEQFIAMAESGLGKQVAKGVFGAEMKVNLVNDGPLTLVIDSKKRE